jgi:uncharacterized protein (TIGR03067 family)
MCVMIELNWKGVAALMVAAMLVAGRGLGDDKAKSDKELLQGSWKAVSGERDGEKMSEAQLKNWEEMVFKDDTFTREGSEKKDGTFALDPQKDPKEIDLNLTVKGQAATWPGVYELKGDTLKLALKPGRPTALESKGGVLIVFERKK